MDKNWTAGRDVYLLGFQEFHQFRYVIFGAFLAIYILTIFVNVLVISLVYKTHHLHSPMYFFLCHLSLSDIISMTDIVPNMLYILWKGGSHISFAGCLAQFQVYGESLCIVSILLTVMSYDRYLAICKPLHYFSIMDAKLQSRLASLTWLSSFIMTLFIIIQMSLLESCRDNVIDHYFCDFDPFVGLSCTDAYILKMQVIIISGVLVVPTFMFIIVTYLYIGLTIFKINFNSGRQKAFYTCSSHLTVVCIHYGSLMAIYLSSTNGQSFNIKKFLSLLNTFCTPLLNPLIFSLRNMEIKKALLQLLDGVKNPNVPLSHRVNSVVGVGAFNKRKM